MDRCACICCIFSDEQVLVHQNTVVSRKIFVALSGGVDSAVAAYLLKQQGYDVHGIFFGSWQNETELWQECPWKEDLKFARAAAEHLKIPFEIVNFIDEYREKVVDYLIKGYRSGQTPNPDVMCNRYIKFGILVEHARANGFDGIATGHYVRKIEHNGTFSLHEGIDKNKDQSFFLCLVKKTNLTNVYFPLGELTKPEVRRIAADIPLPNAQRKDSQGICFLGSRRVSINDFLEKYIPDAPGDIVTLDGKIIGQHRGLHRYTIGQRKGIGLPSNQDFEHYVVVAKDYRTKQLVVGFDHPETHGLYSSCVRIGALNFLEEPPKEGEILLAKPRYRDPSQVTTWRWIDKATAELSFHEPQRALAVGQATAFYRGDCLVGGGIYREIL